MKALFFTFATLLSSSSFADSLEPLVNGKYILAESGPTNSPHPVLKCEEAVEVIGAESRDFRNFNFSGVTLVQREFDLDDRESVTFFSVGVNHTKHSSFKEDPTRAFSPTIKITMRRLFIQQGEQLLMVKNRIKTRGLILDSLTETSGIECIYNKAKS